MGGWEFAAVAVVCLTVAFSMVVWAVVRAGQGSLRGRGASGVPGAAERGRTGREGQS
ncbi:hypothetical protein ABZ016_23915 [Streptomyces sp. NPDC006372]|uniref:hypothetical protein n=1 Tax=Streptomyces sp. NPDC006372 TaxID=3155599 RepID=UPI0033A80F87